MVYIILGIIFSCLAGFANAMMDILESKWNKSIFKDESFPRPFFESKQVSWINKYDEEGNRLVWFKVFGLKILVPVAFTDAWHLAKSIMLTSFSVICLSCLFIARDIENISVWLCVLIVLLFRVSFGFAFSLCYKKWLILSVTFFVFCLSPMQINAQEVSKKQERLLNRLERTGLQLSDNADTIYLEKQVLRTIIKRDTLYLQKTSIEYRDTCEKSRFELRHERKSDKIDNSFELSKLKQDYKSLQEENKLTKYLSDRMLDSIQKIIRLERIYTRQLSDSLKTEKTLSKDNLKTTRIQSRSWSVWEWLFYITTLLGAFAVGYFINKRLKFL
jgi:hypothetical protein